MFLVCCCYHSILTDSLGFASETILFLRSGITVMCEGNWSQISQQEKSSVPYFVYFLIQVHFFNNPFQLKSWPKVVCTQLQSCFLLFFFLQKLGHYCRVCPWIKVCIFLFHFLKYMHFKYRHSYRIMYILFFSLESNFSDARTRPLK